jgi:ribose transport system ATP-binding protein
MALNSDAGSVLCMKSVRKQYPGVLALDDVNFELRAGEVHCLLGENGAGKSTLMKVLSGALARDSGEILIEGQPVELNSPADAQELGIGIIHQDFKLVPELSVAENILLGNEPMKKGLPFIDYEKMHVAAQSAIAQLGEEIDTHSPIRSLSIAQRQLVEIAKAISRNIRILAMDEPSAPLTEKELKNLFAVIRRLKGEGVGIIYISHRLEEIFEVGDRVTILRDGKWVHTCAIKEIDKDGLIRHMVGRDLANEFPRVSLERGREILRLNKVNAGMLKDVSLTLHRGEILGLAGLVGAGRTELARAIFGADPLERGEIFLDGVHVRPRSPREAIDLGIGLLTEDRNRFGLIMQMNIRENISLSNLRQVLRWPFIDRAGEITAARRFSDELHIKAPTSEQQVEALSGGNRQKVVLARWLFTRSKVLIFDEPTSGIDVGVKYEIYTLINKLAQSGIGVIMISSELPELLGICTRIAVMHEGRLMGVLGRHEASQESIMTMAVGTS